MTGRSPARLVAMVVGLAVALGALWLAVAPSILPAPAPTPPVTPAPGATDAPTSPVEGVVIAVDSAGLNKVNGFTLRLTGGANLAFEIGVLENGSEFPPGHLAEHIATASPVRVFFRVEGVALVVYRLEDAG